MRRTGLVLAASAYGCWSILSPGNAIVLQHVEPLWMQASRTAIAALAVAAWLGPRRGAHVMAVLRDAKLTGALLLGTVLSFSLFSLAQTRIGPAETTLGFFAAPLWTALVGWIALRERVGPAFGPAAAAMVVGGALALGVGRITPDALGVALALGSGVAWALHAVAIRSLGAGHDWRDLLGASMLAAAPVLLVAAVALEPMPEWTAVPAQAWLWTAILVAVPTLAAVGLFQAALQRAPAAAVNLFVGIELAGAVGWSALLLGQRYAPMQLAGVALVLAAVTGYVWWQGRQPAADARRHEGR